MPPANRVTGLASVTTVVEAVQAILDRPPGAGTALLDATTPIGRIVIGDGLAGRFLVEQLRRLDARRALVVSEPGAWGAVGESIAAALEAAGMPLELGVFPQGEAAKRLSLIEHAASALADLRVERSEPLVAVGGGALGDSAGFLAATYLRGIPLIHVPTTLVAQLDSSIGGKTAVDLPEGKNLVGAFHQPVAVITDVSLLRTLPERQRRAALGEAVKMAALGDERLFELLEAEGDAVARGTDAAFDSGAVAEVVERAAWAKVEVVLADERERGGPAGATGTAAAGRLALNLGHSLGHAVEAAGGYETPAPWRGGRLRAARRQLDRREPRADAAGAGRADRAPARCPRARARPAAAPGRDRPRPPRDRQEARRRSASVGPADERRGRRPVRRPGRYRRGGAVHPARTGRPGGHRPMTVVLVLQGPNLNLLGTRQPEIYGRATLDEIHAAIARRGRRARPGGRLLPVEPRGDADRSPPRARLRRGDRQRRGADPHVGLLRDALLAIERPFIEVHLSDPSTREPFRTVNFLHDIALESIVGQGAAGYTIALDSIARRVAAGELPG